MEKVKRVMFLLGHLHKGGMQKIVSNLSRALSNEISPYVVYFGTENPPFEFKGEMVNLNIPGSINTGIVTKFINFRKRVKVLQKFIDSHDINTVVSFGEIANVLNLFAKRKRTILAVHISLKQYLSEGNIYTYIYKLLIRMLYKKADLVTCVSIGIAEQLQSKYRIPQHKVKVMYNFHNLDEIRELAKEELEEDIKEIFSRPTVINVGSLVYQKGQEYLIRTFAMAKKNRPDLRLVILGRGELLNFLEKLADNLGVKDSVHFLGFRKNPFKYIANADVFVMTSRYEGFPNVLVEAMICGLPIISTNCETGPRELLGNSEYGVLLPNITQDNRQDIEQSIAEWIVKLLANIDLKKRYKEKSLIRGMQFSNDSIIQEWLKII